MNISLTGYSQKPVTQSKVMLCLLRRRWRIRAVFISRLNPVGFSREMNRGRQIEKLNKLLQNNLSEEQAIELLILSACETAR